MTDYLTRISAPNSLESELPCL